MQCFLQEYEVFKYKFTLKLKPVGAVMCALSLVYFGDFCYNYLLILQNTVRKFMLIMSNCAPYFKRGVVAYSTKRPFISGIKGTDHDKSYGAKFSGVMNKLIFFLLQSIV